MPAAIAAQWRGGAAPTVVHGDDVENIEQLALVLVDALDLDVEHGRRIHLSGLAARRAHRTGHTSTPYVCVRYWARCFLLCCDGSGAAATRAVCNHLGRHKLLEEGVVVDEALEAAQQRQVGGPLVAQHLHPVCMHEPARASMPG